MRWRRVAAALLVAGGFAGVASQPAAAAAQARIICHVDDARIREASGIARGIASPRVFYVHNDSGDTNRFFALDSAGCDTVATITVTGARNVDWEDLAVGRDATGTPSVWLADIGDNRAARREVQVYRVDEPRLAAVDRGADLSTERADVWRLRYPGGPVNAESFAVTPQGVGYVVTKSLLGESAVYRLPARPDASRVQVWQPVGSISFTPTGSGGRFGPAGALLATGAAISRDGSLLAVRTYDDAYLWPVQRADVAAALREIPTRLALPGQQQGEGIAIDGDEVILDSEGADQAIIAVLVPPLTAGQSASAATGSERPSTSAAGSSPPSGGSSSDGSGGRSGSWLPGIVIVTLLLTGSLAWWILQLRGRPSR